MPLAGVTAKGDRRTTTSRKSEVEAKCIDQNWIFLIFEIYLSNLDGGSISTPYKNKIVLANRCSIIRVGPLLLITQLSDRTNVNAPGSVRNHHLAPALLSLNELDYSSNQVALAWLTLSLYFGNLMLC